MLDKQRYILQALSSNQFCSGEALGNDLGISRSAIAKHIRTLQQIGIEIYSVPGRGYRLARTIELLDPDLVNSQLKHRHPHLPAPQFFDVLNSTNQYLLDQLRLGGQQIASGQACVAEMQTAGRGRRGRAWISPFASSLYFSVYWRLASGIQGAMGLSLMVGVCIAEALQRNNVERVQLKWPNDIYIDGRKLGGILVELVGQVGDGCDLVIGVGLNIALPKEATAAITQPWIDLQEVLTAQPCRNSLLVDLLDSLYSGLVLFEAQGLAAFSDRWRSLDMFCDKPVKLISGEHVVRGIYRGIDAMGALLLESEEGKLTSHLGGEISLRATA